MNNNSSSTIDNTSVNEFLPFQKIFEVQPSLILILSPDLIIQNASDAYLRESFTKREDIVGRYIFDIFPENPNVPDISSEKSLKASLEQVITTGKAHKLDTFRYDILDPSKSNSFLERYWSTTNIPVLNDNGTISCIIHETVNVTEQVKANLLIKDSQVREQQALAQAEQHRMRLERLFAQSPAALAMLEGPEFTYRVINDAYQQLFPGRELLHKPLFEALPELKDQIVAEIIQNVYQTGETFEGKEILIPVARYADKPIENIYWNFIYQALYDAQGQVNGILIFALDVTPFVEARLQVERSAKELQTLNQELEERVQRRTKELQIAQAEAVLQKDRLTSLFVQAPVGIGIYTGKDFIIELVNPFMEDILGRPADQILNRPLFEALTDVKGQGFEEILAGVMETGVAFEAKEIPATLLRNGKQETRYYHTLYEPMRDIHQQISGILQIAYDVTEQVETRQAVEAGANQLRLITDSLPVLIGYVDKEEKYQFANKAYETWLGIDAESLLGQTVLEIVGEKAYANVNQYVKRALEGERLDFETTMHYKQGVTKHIQTSYVPDLREGIVYGFYALVTDVTNQVESRKAIEKSEQDAKAMAEELAKANEGLRVVNQQLTHTNVDLDNFIYAASHDLRAPISNIEMLMKELMTELPAECLQQEEVNNLVIMMNKSIDRFKKTIINLTEISKLQKDNNTAPKAVNLAQIVEEVRLDLEPFIKESGAQVETFVGKDTRVSFSEKNIRSVIYNLLSNAIKYKHPNRVAHVQIRCQEEDNQCVLKVQDNGLGLSPENKEKLFSMFRRFHDHVEGSGVGLYMVKRVLDNAGGRIEVESKLGEGTTFTVYFKR